jgi:DNA-binding NarL/FixJ family response regulator
MTRSFSKDKIKVIICDDHAVVRMGLGQILSDTDGMMVLGEAENGNELLKQMQCQPADVVVMDINMPEKSGWDTLAQLKILYPKLPVIILSIYPEEDYSLKFIKAGASSYLNKTTAPKQIVQAIRKVAAGEKYISAKVGQLLAEDLEASSDKPIHASLSPREFQITLMIASGKTVGQIAEELSLSVQTISTHRSRILEKMKMKTNAQLTHYAFKNKLLE